MGVFCGWGCSFITEVSERNILPVLIAVDFDISFTWGSFSFLRGKEAPFLDYATCRKVSEIKEGRV